MRFEKWQALGNDYLIVEASDLSFPLTPQSCGGSATATPVLARTECSSCRRRTRPATSRGCGSSTRTAPRPSCRATARARRSSTCAARARPTRTSSRSRRRRARSGRRSCRRPPAASTWAVARDPGRRGEIAGLGYRQLDVGNPQCAIRVATLEELEALDLPAIGPPIENDPRFPNRTNVSFWCADRRRRDPRADLRARRGGDAVVGHRRLRRGGRVRAARAARSPVTVAARRRRAEVGVGDVLRIDLTGWAVPVYRGELLSSAAISD